MDLILPVKRKWFDRIKDGTKQVEYRLVNDYWIQRVKDRDYDRVIITLGYPKRDDQDRRIVFPWNGYYMSTIHHEEWDYKPRLVYAIRLTPNPSMQATRSDGVDKSEDQARA